MFGHSSPLRFLIRLSGFKNIIGFYFYIKFPALRFLSAFLALVITHNEYVLCIMFSVSVLWVLKLHCNIVLV